MEVCLLSGKRWFMNGLALLVMAAPAFSQIEVYHKTVSVEVGKTYQFASYVPLSPNTVVWSVNGIVGGNATIGTVSSTGRYAAPAVAPVPSVLAVRATSTAFPDRFGEATVTRPTPWVWSVSPAPVPAGDFSIRLNGSNFTPDAQVRLNGMPLATTYVSSTSLRATGNAAAGAGSIAVYLPGPGQVTSQAVAVNFVSAALTVSPASASVVTGGTRAFTANMPVTWMASAGSISAAGVFTAPAMAGVVTVTAKRVADPNESGHGDGDGDRAAVDDYAFERFGCSGGRGFVRGECGGELVGFWGFDYRGGRVYGSGDGWGGDGYGGEYG